MITELQFLNAAKIIGCSISCIKAVYEIEAAGRGYLSDGRVKILFEGHRFWKQLIKAGISKTKLQEVAAIHQNVVYEIWDSRQYKGGLKEWERMSEAIEVCKLLNVNPVLALKSASYGSFQIMGENAELCGYPDAQAMLAAYNNKGEAEQLDSFCRFIQATGLDDELRNKNWPGFAKGYNGTAYKLNRYDTKLAAAEMRFSK